MKMVALKKIIDDIQTGGDMLWKMAEDFPDSMKGTIAKKMWYDSDFTYGIEYGALIILHYLLKNSELGESTGEP